MRLKPLRGQKYETNKLETVIFLEKTFEGNAKILTLDDEQRIIHIEDLMLPIIDTKDYEKIEDRKYKGD